MPILARVLLVISGMRIRTISIVRAVALLFACSFTVNQLYLHKAVLPELRADIRFVSHILEASTEHGVNPALVAAIIEAESNFDPRAKSHAGAKGLMQVNNITAREVGLKNAYDPKENIFAGVAYLKFLSSLFKGNVELMLAAYNAGPSAVKRFGGVPPYKETRKYVIKVKKLLHFYSSHPDIANS